uniref:BRICHOS domain-containing protein n=1 Tax=Clytia hemisphaerica TaxID=252671 RepID=A0A7M5WTC0_9CNID|eukprot:TCONS_00009211-protein
MAWVKLFALAFIALAAASDYHLEFNEKQQKYDERVHIDKQNGILIYRVPKHAGVVAAHYLKDFNKQMTVLKVFTEKRCYISKMGKDEPSIDDIELGMQKANGVFDSKKYWIETEDVITLGHANKLSLSSAILNFCGSFDILDTVKNNQQTREALKMKAVAQYKSGKSKRLLVEDYVYCKNDQSKMSAEMAKCNKKFDQLEFNCRFVRLGTCIYTVKCLLTQQGYNCPGTHQYTHLNCCTIRCKA